MHGDSECIKDTLISTPRMCQCSNMAAVTDTANEIFRQFCNASTFPSILGSHKQLLSVLDLKPSRLPLFYPQLKTKLRSWHAQAVWVKLDKRASHEVYGGATVCADTRVLVIGAGPCGLRTAIEAQLLGAKVVVVEKRDRFSRNNVLHLWPYNIADLRGLGAKKFYGKFCAGAIDHISIRQLQCILLKVSLLLGVEVLENVEFKDLIEPLDSNTGWRARVRPAEHPVSRFEFDVLLGADGKRNTLRGFGRKEFRGKLAIAITANFVNGHTEAESHVEEISGLAFVFNQKFFNDLNAATGIALENIVYYKDETHYFVMTAKKQSLLGKGVLLRDDSAKLLSRSNVDYEALFNYAREAADYVTGRVLSLQFALNHHGKPDVAIFDFTSMFQAEHSCRILKRNGHRLLLGLVGDSLLEPFWPTGTGCARGFFGGLDTCWLMRNLALGKHTLLEALAERESIYRLINQTTPENTCKDFASYTTDPMTRYPTINRKLVLPSQVMHLVDTDDLDLIKEELSWNDVSKGRKHGLLGNSKNISQDEKKKKRRRRISRQQENDGDNIVSGQSVGKENTTKVTDRQDSLVQLRKKVEMKTTNRKVTAGTIEDKGAHQVPNWTATAFHDKFNDMKDKIDRGGEVTTSNSSNNELLCHFCNKRVYAAEQMGAERKLFHRACFRCDYCQIALRLGGYVYIRKGPFSDKFLCVPHSTSIGFEKYRYSSKAEELLDAANRMKERESQQQKSLTEHLPKRERSDSAPGRVDLMTSLVEIEPRLVDNHRKEEKRRRTEEAVSNESEESIYNLDSDDDDDEKLEDLEQANSQVESVEAKSRLSEVNRRRDLKRTLRVFTLNCWGIGYLPFLKSPHRQERMRAIADFLATDVNEFDFICLQEIWLQEDRSAIAEACKSKFPHTQEYHGGVIGTGLMLLSRWPIISARFFRFSVNGLRHQVWHGDGLVAKGVAMAMINLGEGLKVALCTSHLHAKYNQTSDPFLADRCVQALEAAEWISDASATADLVIYAGDFNTEFGELPHAILKHLGNLSDKCCDDDLTAKFFTHDTGNNSYRREGCKERTLDHVMQGPTGRQRRDMQQINVETLRFWNPLEQRVPGKEFSYSDHEGVAAEIRVTVLTAQRMEVSADGRNLLTTVDSILKKEIEKTFWIQAALLALLIMLVTVVVYAVESALLGFVCGCIWSLLLIMMTVFYQERATAMVQVRSQIRHKIQKC